MSAADIFGTAASLLVGIGLYGLITQPHPLRKLLAFNVVGGGVFLWFGVVARRGAASGWEADPVPVALVITGLVVSFAATALGVAMIVRLAESGDDAPPSHADPTRGDDTPPP
jgi:multicomponent Na+:H+ antiporter subunit C